MSHTEAGDATNYPTDITLPDDGDTLDVASMNVGFEGLADRTAWLRANTATPPAVAPTTVTASGAIADGIAFVKVGARSGAITLTVDAGLPIGRTIIFLETGGQDDVATIAFAGGETVTALYGGDGTAPSIRHKNDLVEIQKISSTQWISRAFPTCKTGGTGTFVDQHQDKTRRVLPVCIAQGGIVADGDELTDTIGYGQDDGTNGWSYDYRGLVTKHNTGAAGRLALAFDTSILATEAFSTAANNTTRGPLLKTITLRMLPPGGHAALPQYMPKFGIYRIDPTTPGGRTPMNSTSALVTDTSANVATYETEHSLTFTCDFANIILPGYRYWLEYFDEGGTNSAGTMLIREILFTFGGQ